MIILSVASSFLAFAFIYIGDQVSLTETRENRWIGDMFRGAAAGFIVCAFFFAGLQWYIWYSR